MEKIPEYSRGPLIVRAPAMKMGMALVKKAMSNANPILRKQAHEKGLSALREGRYSEAIQIMELAIEAYGPHIGLLADLVGATYLNGEMALFEIQTERLQKEFVLAEPALSLRSRVLTAITLAKFQEERARWADALEWLNKAKEWIGVGDPLLLRIEMQRLRALADLGRSSEVLDSYQLCLGISRRNPQQYIEAFHALALAEMRLFGFAKAWSRILELENRVDLQAADLSLCLIDLLEMASEFSDREAQETILKYMSAHGVEPRDHYEIAMLKTISTETCPDVTEIQSTLAELTPMSRLRWLAMGVRRFHDESQLLKSLILSLQALDHRSRSFLMTKWEALMSLQAPVEVWLDEKTHCLSSGGREMSLSKSPQSWKILKALCMSPEEVSPLDLLAVVEKNSGEVADLESLRIAVLRLNQKLSGVSSLDWNFRFRKDRILVHPNLHLKMQALQ